MHYFFPIPLAVLHVSKQKHVPNQTENVENCALVGFKCENGLCFSDVYVSELNAMILSTDFPWCVSSSILAYPETHNLLRMHA